MVFVDDVKLKVFHLFSEATSQGIHSMGAACRIGGLVWGWDRGESLTWACEVLILSSLVSV